MCFFLSARGKDGCIKINHRNPRFYHSSILNVKIRKVGEIKNRQHLLRARKGVVESHDCPRPEGTRHRK